MLKEFKNHRFLLKEQSKDSLQQEENLGYKEENTEKRNCFFFSKGVV